MQFALDKQTISRDALHCPDCCSREISPYRARVKSKTERRWYCGNCEATALPDSHLLVRLGDLAYDPLPAP